ncbi:MAG: glycosyltransferase, partial [Sphingomonadaceae bacterium]|nr:glycosyltransferase [Sphingomonadaceae bacterium]
MLRVLTLSTLFPDTSRPTFGPFVERQTCALAARSGVEVEVVAPLGIPPLFARHPRYRPLAALPEREAWHGLTVHRPRFAHLPGNRFDPALLARALRPLLREIRARFPFEVIDAEFFFPDGPAAIALGREFGVPVSIKARGADIHYWGGRAPIRRQIVAAGRAADGLLAVSAALKGDMAALGMPADRIAVHYTGIDRTLFNVRDRAEAKAALGVAGPLIVSVGGLIERKGQQLLIDALGELPDATLVLIGKGEARSRYETRAKAAGVADRVRFSGAVPPATIAGWLAAADVMALPSVS